MRKLLAAERQSSSLRAVMLHNGIKGVFHRLAFYKTAHLPWTGWKEKWIVKREKPWSKDVNCNFSVTPSVVHQFQMKTEVYCCGVSLILYVSGSLCYSFNILCVLAGPNHPQDPHCGFIYSLRTFIVPVILVSEGQGGSECKLLSIHNTVNHLWFNKAWSAT